MPAFHAGKAPRNKGQRYPADPPTVDEIVAVMRVTDERAGLAFDVYAHRRHRCIGAMLPSLCRLDVIVFTGGEGENSPAVRAQAFAPFRFSGALDDALNRRGAAGADISGTGAPVHTLVISAQVRSAIATAAVVLLTVTSLA